ncbi:Very-long-chain 3-oxoacyl-CoA reductase-B [Armadillidium nasatum]|uniref:Very-long-chain 3-oxoacyl-CoA reductase-B n=1 Tax=Armadillidium nasatum TaxID=96803 RepID=A0A5N5STD7_9CRUS|nr:Very-long-chain 3-oxoacyl-CoA reductase-B [Armadillidium nasatum]
MARNGLNVILISRTPYKLQNVASEITSKYKVETKIIDVDFTKSDIYDRIAKELSNLEIGVLINNVGMSYDSPKYFTEVTEKLISDLVSCNIISLTMMTKICVERMQKRKKGLILNVSSLSSLIPAPFLTVYGATKAYVVSFSKSLALEMRGSGVTVQCVTPGFVVSNMSGIKKPSIMTPTPTAYVRSSLKTAGIEESTGGYYMHKLQIMFIELGYRYFFGSWISHVVYNQLNAVRLKAVRKKEREAKSQ